MKIINRANFLALLITIVLLQFFFVFPRNVFAATSPSLGTVNSFSVLGGTTVTCTGSTTTSGDVGVSPGTSITGFPSPCVAGGGGIHSNDATSIAAQADILSVFGAINQTCDQSFGAVDLTATFPSGVGPGVYCSTSSFSLSGNLNLTGSGVWIFKSVSTLITSPGSSVTGGNPCNVWWRVGSAATLDKTTLFIGNILALSGIHMNTGATLNGRALVLSDGDVTLDANTITGPSCAALPTNITPTATPSATPSPTPAGDNLSDGRSSCPSCTQAPQSNSAKGQVLGASTLAQTGQSFQLLFSIIGLIMISFGLWYAKKRLGKDT